MREAPSKTIIMLKILSLINLFEDEVPQQQHESFNFEPIIYAGNVTKK